MKEPKEIENMSLLYKDRKDVKTSVELISSADGLVDLIFTNNGGKHGTYEILNTFHTTTDTLLEILDKHFDED